MNPLLPASELAEIFSSLLEDNSRFVRNAALQHLGQFISTLGSDSEPVPSIFIEKFVAMSQVNTGDETADAEIRLHCAFSFPAVVLAVIEGEGGRSEAVEEGGSETVEGGWETLVEAFQILVRDVMWNVRKTLSCSLHEIAKVLDVKIVERDLLQVFELFLRDAEEVKVSAIVPTTLYRWNRFFENELTPFAPSSQGRSHKPYF